jgi:hypothetical protein
VGMGQGAKHVMTRRLFEQESHAFSVDRIQRTCV